MAIFEHIPLCIPDNPGTAVNSITKPYQHSGSTYQGR